MRTPPPVNALDLEAATATAQQVIDTLRRGLPWSLHSRTAAHWTLRQRIASASGSRRGVRNPLLRGFALGSMLATAGALLWFWVLGADAMRRVDDGRPSSGVLSGAGAITAAAATTAGGAEAWTQIELPDLGSLELSMGEGFEVRELPGERQLRFNSGTLRAHILRQDPARPAVIVTKHVRVIVVGTRFDVTETDLLTRVDVLEGKVRVESASGSVVLTGGMSVRSDDARLRLPSGRSEGAPASAAGPEARPPSPSSGVGAFASSERSWPMRRTPVHGAEVPPRAIDCERIEAVDAQGRCFEQIASGDDLAAQNALFALAVSARDVDGMPERAAELFDAYVRRFPTGPLAPEAALGRLEVLERLGRAEEVIASAIEFERRFAADARAPEVALVRAQLECRDPPRRGPALRLLDRLAARPQPSLREAALRARAECDAEASIRGAAPEASAPPPSNAAGPPPD